MMLCQHLLLGFSHGGHGIVRLKLRPGDERRFGDGLLRRRLLLLLRVVRLPVRFLLRIMMLVLGGVVPTLGAVALRHVSAAAAARECRPVVVAVKRRCRRGRCPRGNGGMS